jgi:hypothetical protein
MYAKRQSYKLDINSFFRRLMDILIHAKDVSSKDVSKAAESCLLITV